MNFDIVLVISFLLITLVVGLSYGKNVKNIKDYALGGRNFSTTALVATIVATWASSSAFFITMSKTYSDGLYFLFASSGLGLSFIITSYFLVPRMEEFLGKTSVAEAMGDLYGQKVRVITAIAGTIGASGSIAVQFKVFGNLFSYFLHIPSYVAITIAGIIATIYSAFGGIRAVTFTDILQFFSFGIIIPLVGFIIWSDFYYQGLTLVQATSDPSFNIYSIFNINNPQLFGSIMLFIYLAIPTFSAPAFQRIAIGNNITQVKKAFLIAGIFLILIQLITAWIPFLIHSMNPYLEKDNLLGYIVDHYSYVGLRGLILVAIIALAMSTADSRINSASVLFTNDICTAFTNKLKNELFISKIFAFFLGLGAIFFSLVETDLLNIIVLANSFYYPIVTPPILLTICGFRSTSKSVLIGIAAGFITTILWKVIPNNIETAQNIIGVLLAMFCNTIFLFGSHYILKQKGGWVGLKDQESFNKNKIKQQKNRKRFIHSIIHFSIKNYLTKHTPKKDLTYTMLGFYFIVFTLSTMYSTHQNLLGKYSNILFVIYQLMLVTSTIMAMYQLWPLSIKYELKKSIIRIWWPIATFYMLIFFSGFFVMVSQFAQLQLLLFAINIMIASILLGWQCSILAMPIGIYSSMRFYHYYFGENNFQISFGSPEFILLYFVLIIALALLFFLKPKEEQYNVTEQKADYLSHKLDDQTVELKKSLELKQEFLRNLEHEARTPITSISTMGSILHESYDKLSEKQRRNAIKDIAESSERLNSLISNILDLSKLSGLNYQLNITDIDFSELVYERVKICRKLYTEDKYKDLQEVTLDIRDNIIVSCDQNYITTAIDNIVINSLQYCTDGKITIILYKNEQKEVVFKVQDEGIGIPKEELYDVFGAFTVSSKTKTPAGGRGVGLALSKKVVDLHNGRIWTKQNSDKGVTVGFNLPLKNVDI